ncbi:MAG TPA: histidine kinase [Vicinamibacterales bacterium]|nr:histidine kinase [Vicinamibacterales bacterium]
MRKVWTPPWRSVLGVATALGVFSTLQAYRLTLVNLAPGEQLEPGHAAKLLVLNLAYWYIPALMMPAVVRVARQFPLDDGRRTRTILVHITGALSFAALDFVGLMGVRFLLWENAGKSYGATWAQFLQRRLFDQLDWSLMVYAVSVGVSHAIAFYHESQQRKLASAQLEARLMEARLKTLEAELHPHFLFNTLHAISTLVHRDPESADRMISRLSDLLRITFDRSGEAKVSLKEEIDFLQKYLDIEQMRFQDRLTVSVRIDPDALDGEVPRMILQPIAENAVKHGIAGRKGGDRILITAGRAGDRLWMQVHDNGGGLQVRTLRALRTGVGLSNTRARLDCLYGRHYRLEFSDTHGGLAVLIEIPFQRAVPASPAAFRVA